jgi:hypothetical protein
LFGGVIAWSVRRRPLRVNPDEVISSIKKSFFERASNGVHLICAGNDLDDLTAPQSETSPEAEALRGTINDQARNPLWLGSKADHHTGTLLRGDSLRATIFMGGNTGHCFVL